MFETINRKLKKKKVENKRNQKIMDRQIDKVSYWLDMIIKRIKKKKDVINEKAWITHHKKKSDTILVVKKILHYDINGQTRTFWIVESRLLLKNKQMQKIPFNNRWTIILYDACLCVTNLHPNN